VATTRNFQIDPANITSQRKVKPSSFLNSNSWTRHSKLCPLMRILLQQKKPPGRIRRGCREGPIGRYQYPRSLCTLPASNLSYVGIKSLGPWEPALTSYPSRRQWQHDGGAQKLLHSLKSDAYSYGRIDR